MNWHIGQRIVAIKSQPDGYFKKGGNFTISSLRLSQCKCEEVEIAIGLTESAPFRAKCRDCGCYTINPSGLIFWSETFFSPIEEIPASHEEQIKELLIIKEPQKI